MPEVLSDKNIQRAVSAIPQRAERERDAQKLAKSFVDTGILMQLDNPNHQILYGRRGTGKTHVLKVLMDSVQSATSLVIYVDMRTLGSNTQGEPGRTAAHDAVLLFKDLLAPIHDALIERALAGTASVTDQGWDSLNGLSEVITKVASIKVDEQVTERSRDEAEATSQGSASVEAGAEGAGLKFGLDDSAKNLAESETTRSFKSIQQHHVVFSEVYTLLERAAKGCGLDHIYVLIDEWSTVGSHAQPFLAEYIKRSLLPSPYFTLKVAALEYRADFSLPLEKNNVLGFELGPDISANLDLDDYYVYDRNPEAIATSFEELLFRHLETELPKDYLKATHGITEPGALTRDLFNNRDTLKELVRAAEGVARDFINIFSMSFFNSSRRGRSNIDMQAILEAARSWYEQDKSPQLNRVQEQVLSNILNVVIGERKARSFMIKRSEAHHPIIRSLFDFRVLHLILKGYSDKSNPGVRYNIYTLDYGLYVDLRRTSQCPEMELPLIDRSEDAADRIVPFDDKRSIRRIIVTSDMLDRWAAAAT